MLSQIKLATVNDQRILPPQGLCSEFMENPGIVIGKTLQIKLKDGDSGHFIKFFVQVKSVVDYPQGFYLNFDPIHILFGEYSTYEINYVHWGTNGWVSLIRGMSCAFPDDKGRPNKMDWGNIHPEVSQI